MQMMKHPTYDELADALRLAAPVLEAFVSIDGDEHGEVSDAHHHVRRTLQRLDVCINVERSIALLSSLHAETRDWAESLCGEREDIDDLMSRIEEHLKSTSEREKT